VGYMLAPSARKRTVAPLLSASSITAPKVSECRMPDEWPSVQQRPLPPRALE